MALGGRSIGGCRSRCRALATALTALEAAIALPDSSAFFDRALQRHVAFDEVYRAYCRGVGRRDSAAAGPLLIAAADRADSAAERIVVRFFAVRLHTSTTTLGDAGTDGKAFADVGATWWLTDFDPERRTLDEVRGVLRGGPA